MIDITKQRIQHFIAWKKLLSSRQANARNPFHEPGDYRKSMDKIKAANLGDAKGDQLSEELQAWEAASDEALETFEGSLE